MKVPQIIIETMTAITDGNMAIASVLAEFAEMTRQGKVKVDCDKTQCVKDILDGVIRFEDLERVRVERKKREMSQEYMDKQYEKQVAKLREKYNQNGKEGGNK